MRRLAVAMVMMLSFAIPRLTSAALPPLVAPLTPIGDGLSAPTRIAMDSRGLLYVADPRRGGVVILTLDGLPAPGESVVQTQAPPIGVAVTPGGDLLVCEGTIVAAYRKTNGTFSRTATLSPPDGFGTPNGIAVAPDGTIYVADSTKDRISIFSPTYSHRSSFGTSGSGSGQFSLPTAVAFDRAAGQILVVDTLNGRIQFFDRSGTFIRSIGTRGVDLNGADDTVEPNLVFTSPHGIALEYSRTAPERLERIYVADSYQSRVQVVDPSGAGRRLRYVGSYGSTAGKLLHPADILFDQFNSRIIVTNGMGNLVPFGIDGGVTPPIDTPPRLSVDTPPTLIRSDSFTLTGTVDRPAIVEVSVTGGSATVSPVTFTSVSSWQATVSSLQPEQLTTLKVTARSVGGSQTSRSFDVTYHPDAPTLAIDPLPSPVTVADSLTISGTAESEANVSVTGPAGTSAQVTRSGTTWRATLNGLAPGPNDFTVTASARNLSTSETISITRAVVTPTMLPSGSGTATPFVTVSGDISGVTEVQISLDGKTPVTVPVVDGRFSYPVLLARGSNTVSITVRDGNGGTSTSTVTLTHDPSLPSVTIDGLISGGITYGEGGAVPSGTPSPTLTGSLRGSSVTVTLDGGTTLTPTVSGTTWSAPLPPNLLPGTHTAVVTVSDNGKSSSAAVSFRVVDPAAAPPLSLSVAPESNPSAVSYGHLATGRNRLTITGTTDGSTLSVDVSLDGTGLPVELDRTTGRFTVTLPADLTTEGVHTLIVTAYGPNDSTTTLSRSVSYTTERPALAVQSSGNQTIYTLGSGYVTAFYVDDVGNRRTLPVAPDGTVTIPSGGIEQRRITFVDHAGNSSRNGRLTAGSGEPGLPDVLTAIRIHLEMERATTDMLLTGDVAPLVNGTPVPDGKIDAQDALAILLRVVGSITW